MFFSYVSLSSVQNFMAVRLFVFWVTFGTMLQLCAFCYFEILTKTFFKNLKIGKSDKISTQVKCSY